VLGRWTCSAEIRSTCSPCSVRASPGPHPIPPAPLRQIAGVGVSWCQLVSVGAGWCRLVPVGVSWCQLVPVGVSWCQLVSVGVGWCRLVSVGVSWCQLVSVGVSWCQLVPVGASWCRLVSVGASWCQLVSVGVSWCQLVSVDRWGGCACAALHCRARASLLHLARCFFIVRLVQAATEPTQCPGAREEQEEDAMAEDADAAVVVSSPCRTGAWVRGLGAGDDATAGAGAGPSLRQLRSACLPFLRRAHILVEHVALRCDRCAAAAAAAAAAAHPQPALALPPGAVWGHPAPTLIALAPLISCHSLTHFVARSPALRAQVGRHTATRLRRRRGRGEGGGGGGGVRVVPPSPRHRHRQLAVVRRR
jgi:hypothetical protein